MLPTDRPREHPAPTLYLLANRLHAGEAGEQVVCAHGECAQIDAGAVPSMTGTTGGDLCRRPLIVDELHEERVRRASGNFAEGSQPNVGEGDKPVVSAAACHLQARRGWVRAAIDVSRRCRWRR